MNTFLTFSFMLLIAPITIHALHVIVDPGHGGENHGAVYYGVKEADINLQVGSHLARLLKNDSRFKVTLTRHKDTELSLEERAELARRAGGNVFLSIHTNAFNRPQAKGVEFYF